MSEERGRCPIQEWRGLPFRALLCHPLAQLGECELGIGFSGRHTGPWAILAHLVVLALDTTSIFHLTELVVTAPVLSLQFHGLTVWTLAVPLTMMFEREQVSTAATCGRATRSRDSRCSCRLSRSIAGQSEAAALEYQSADQPTRPDGGSPNNRWVDFHDQRRSNATHQSTTDPDARLNRKGPGKEARLTATWARRSWKIGTDFWRISRSRPPWAPLNETWCRT